MKDMKKIFSVMMLLCLLMSAFSWAFADTLPETDPGWKVTFNADGDVESNFKSSNLDETVSGMQPGDDAVFRITISNDNEKTTSWYMENKVLYSLEDRSKNKAIKGGAYSYVLTYKGADGTETELFNSDKVGGDGKEDEGLKEATEGLENWFFLGDMEKGQDATVTLKISLEGETQGNNYQDTLADLTMNFAVETKETPAEHVSPKPVPTPPSHTVKTGEGNSFLIWICTGAAGIVLMILAIILKKRNDRKEISE